MQERDSCPGTDSRSGAEYSDRAFSEIIHTYVVCGNAKYKHGFLPEGSGENGRCAIMGRWGGLSSSRYFRSKRRLELADASRCSSVITLSVPYRLSMHGKFL